MRKKREKCGQKGRFEVICWRYYGGGRIGRNGSFYAAVLNNTNGVAE